MADSGDWRHLAVTNENLAWTHENVRCVCGHDPFQHYDTGSFCMACMDDGRPDEEVCMEFVDQPNQPQKGA